MLRTTLSAAAIALLLSGCAATRGGLHHGAAPGAGLGSGPDHGSMAMMDDKMKSMRGMHEKMMRAKTPEERRALMQEHMKTMREGMAMMDGMGAMRCTEQVGSAQCQQMMERRMEMMQGMMQMMMQMMMEHHPDSAQ